MYMPWKEHVFHFLGCRKIVPRSRSTSSNSDRNKMARHVYFRPCYTTQRLVHLVVYSARRGWSLLAGHLSYNIATKSRDRLQENLRNVTAPLRSLRIATHLMIPEADKLTLGSCRGCENSYSSEHGWHLPRMKETCWYFELLSSALLLIHSWTLSRFRQDPLDWAFLRTTSNKLHRNRERRNVEGVMCIGHGNHSESSTRIKPRSAHQLDTVKIFRIVPLAF